MSFILCNILNAILAACCQMRAENLYTFSLILLYSYSFLPHCAFALFYNMEILLTRLSFEDIHSKCRELGFPLLKLLCV